ncbi:hypothetical protein [Zhongshania borealis]|uniref:Uncharacterized protein n=1 Tax=Zhongshania borealis TaxID=889488 RepID=A0ABP7X7Q3_9GAMM
MEFEYVSERKPRKCPKCGGKRIAQIFYGMPAFDEKMEADLQAGKIVLGGCDPGLLWDAHWQCVDCDAQICRQKDVDVYKVLFDKK